MFKLNGKTMRNFVRSARCERRASQRHDRAPLPAADAIEKKFKRCLLAPTNCHRTKSALCVGQIDAVRFC